MQIASSANLTWSELRSASLYTATVRIPSSRHAFNTRSAISPRLATSTLRNMHDLWGDSQSDRVHLSGPNRKQRLSKLDGLPVRNQALYHLPRHIRFDLVHQLHRLNDA